MKSFESTKNIGDSIMILSDKIKKNLVGLNPIEQAKIAVSINMLLSREIKVIEDFLRLSVTAQEEYNSSDDEDNCENLSPTPTPSTHQIEYQCPDDADDKTGNDRNRNIKIVWRLSPDFIRQMKAAGYSINNNGDVLLNGEAVPVRTNTYDKYIVIDNIGYRVADIVLGFNNIYASEHTKTIRFLNTDRLDTRFENLSYCSTNGKVGINYRTLPTDSVFELCEAIARYKTCKDTLNYLRRVKKIKISSTTFYKVRSKQIYGEISDKFFILKKNVDTSHITESDIISVIDATADENNDEIPVVNDVENITTDNQPANKSDVSDDGYDVEIENNIETQINKKVTMKMKLDVTETEYIVKKVSNIIQSLDISELQKGVRKYYKTDITVGVIKNIVDRKIDNLKGVVLYEDIHK